MSKTILIHQNTIACCLHSSGNGLKSTVSQLFEEVPFAVLERLVEMYTTKLLRKTLSFSLLDKKNIQISVSGVALENIGTHVAVEFNGSFGKCNFPIFCVQIKSAKLA